MHDRVLRTAFWLFVWIQCGWLSIGAVWGQSDVSLSEKDAREYQARSFQKEGDYYYEAEVKISSTPDSSTLFEATTRVQSLYCKAKRLSYTSFERTSETEDPDRVTMCAIPCQSKQLQFEGKTYRSFNSIHQGQWKLVDKVFSVPICEFPSPLDWPFAYFKMIQKGGPITDFSRKECLKSVEQKGVRYGYWTGIGGKGQAITEVAFQEGVPIVYKIHLFNHDVGYDLPDPKEAQVISSIRTTWKEIEKRKYPVELSGVVEEAGYTLDVSAKFQWRIGKDIPQELVAECEHIAASMATPK